MLADLLAEIERQGGYDGVVPAKVAAARKLLTLVYYWLRNGHIRCLAHGTLVPPAG